MNRLRLALSSSPAWAGPAAKGFLKPANRPKIKNRQSSINNHCNLFFTFAKNNFYNVQKS